MRAFLSSLLVAASLAACFAATVVQPSVIYGLPSGASEDFHHFRASRALRPAFHPGLRPPPAAQAAPAPVWTFRQPMQRQLVQQRPGPPGPPGPPRRQQAVPQSYFRLAPQPQPQFVTEQQGVWRYSRPARPQPIREDQAPHQGLGATDSVTMPEAAPFDPLLVTGPAAAHFVRVLTDREPHFFPAFPHTRLVLNNQQKRLDNGLHANRLGSIRLGSDFLRGD